MSDPSGTPDGGADRLKQVYEQLSGFLADVGQSGDYEVLRLLLNCGRCGAEIGAVYEGLLRPLQGRPEGEGSDAGYYSAAGPKQLVPVLRPRFGYRPGVGLPWRRGRLVLGPDAPGSILLHCRRSQRHGELWSVPTDLLVDGYRAACSDEAKLLNGARSQVADGAAPGERQLRAREVPKLRRLRVS